MSVDVDLPGSEWVMLKAPQIVAAAVTRFGRDRIVLATSFGPEDQVLTDMLLAVDVNARIFTLDTGRLFQETYDVWQATQAKYGAQIESYAPESTDLELLVKSRGPNLFYESIDDRRRCCEMRKLRPLRRALATADAWICGLRREQSITRDGISLVEPDKTNGLIKINPLVDWTEQEVWAYIRANNVPFNRLSDRGFRSIGCTPCTRVVGDGEDARAGRWWWESPEHKECGLHKKTVS